MFVELAEATSEEARAPAGLSTLAEEALSSPR
jgi:hypothetical protein